MKSFPIVGVLAACGGAGSSVFAALLAGAAGKWSAPFLIDCDPLGGGVDVLLGCEQAAGARWSQVRLQGGDLDPTVLRDGLPRWGPVSVLAADTSSIPDPLAVRSVIRAAATSGPVVLDLPRWPGGSRTQALETADLVILVTPAEIRAVTAASVVLSALVADGVERTSVVAVVRGSSRALPPDRVAALLGVRVLGVLPHDGASLCPSGLALSRIRRQTRAAAMAVWALPELGVRAEAA